MPCRRSTAESTWISGRALGQIQTLENERSELEAQLIAGQERQTSVESQLTGISTSFQEWQATYDAVQTEYESAAANYGSQEASYRQLSTEHEISEALRIGHLLADYYDEVRDGFGDAYGGYYLALSSGLTWQEQVDFAAGMARHGLGTEYWPSYEHTYYDHAGEYSYVTALNGLDRVLNVIGIEPGDSATQKIEKILGFINAHLQYEHDFNDAYLAPMETLGFRSGDCDDFTILTAALFEEAGIDAAIAFLTNGSTYHAMVLVHLDDISPYQCYSYSDLTSSGLQAGEWLMIEPQSARDDQLTDWVHQWSIVAAAEV